ncbi:hypothetical protein [Bacillus sp. USDA818B3_A]|uniref:hypothetical protein n=1 Tax=Bacillus sp. USDA818B3_A TaxID=2698834 RepID=UPI00136E2160|nr:hypothetical protein [Bacillus sp. USDA818B3_A]
MADQSKIKGKRTVGTRLFSEEEKNLQGLRPRTFREYRTTFKYFLSLLQQKYPDIYSASEITTGVIRNYFYYMSKEKRIWDDHTKASCQYKTDKKGLHSFTVNIMLAVSRNSSERRFVRASLLIILLNAAQEFSIINPRIT